MSYENPNLKETFQKNAGIIASIPVDAFSKKSLQENVSSTPMRERFQRNAGLIIEMKKPKEVENELDDLYQNALELDRLEKLGLHKPTNPDWKEPVEEGVMGDLLKKLKDKVSTTAKEMTSVKGWKDYVLGGSAEERAKKDDDIKTSVKAMRDEYENLKKEAAASPHSPKLKKQYQKLLDKVKDIKHQTDLHRQYKKDPGSVEDFSFEKKTKHFLPDFNKSRSLWLVGQIENPDTYRPELEKELRNRLWWAHLEDEKKKSQVVAKKKKANLLYQKSLDTSNPNDLRRMDNVPFPEVHHQVSVKGKEMFIPPEEMPTKQDVEADVKKEMEKQGVDPAEYDKKQKSFQQSVRREQEKGPAAEKAAIDKHKAEQEKIDKLSPEEKAAEVKSHEAKWRERIAKEKANAEADAFAKAEKEKEKKSPPKNEPEADRTTENLKQKLNEYVDETTGKFDMKTFLADLTESVRKQDIQ